MICENCEEDSEQICSECRCCEFCCDCEDDRFSADELGLDPEEDQDDR